MGNENFNPFSELPSQHDELKIVPMGGCGMFGMNMTAYLYLNRCVIVDCGVMFPDARKLGVSSVIPEVDRWFEACGGVSAYIITHGHEDHIGALPFIYPRWPAPIFATPWTAELIKAKFELKGVQQPLDLNIVRAGDTLNVSGIQWQYVHVNHSIPDTCCLVIQAGRHKIFHSGDFKWDPNPYIEAEMDFATLKNIQAGSIDVAFTDSTNAFKEGFCPGERSTFAPLKDVISQAKGVTFLTTFSSNLWRLVVLVEVCRELNKSLYIDSRSIQQTLNIADRLGYFPMPKDTLVEEHDLSYIPRESLVVAATGCQGEYRSSLKRIAQREHRLFKIHSGDLVVFSSRMIPGNEQAIVHMTSDLENQGAKIVTARECPSIHVSGHAYGGELEKLMDILKPRYYVPIHGNHSHLLANKEVAKQSSTATENVFKIENGSVIHLKDGVLTVPQQLDIKWEYVDDYSNLLVSQNVLRERLKIGEQGLFTVQGVYSLQNKAFLRNLEITAHGLELPRHLDADTWFEDAAEELMKSILGWKLTLDSEDQCNESLRIQLRKKLSLIFSKKPVVISRLMFLK